MHHVYFAHIQIYGGKKKTIVKISSDFADFSTIVHNILSLGQRKLFIQQLS